VQRKARAIKGGFSYYTYIYILSAECGPLLTGNNRIIRHFNGASDGFFGNSLTYNIYSIINTE